MDSDVKPVPIALVVCDNIYSEPGGKTALVGLFNKIGSATFPCRHPRLAVFVSVTSVRKGMRAKLDIVHSETDQPIAVAEGEFPDQLNPITIVDMNFILNNVTFPEPGTYYIRFFANTHPIVMRPFEVVDTSGKGSS